MLILLKVVLNFRKNEVLFGILAKQYKSRTKNRTEERSLNSFGVNYVTLMTSLSVSVKQG